MNTIKRFNEKEYSKINWDDLLQELRRDMGANTHIKIKDFRYLEKWLFNKILNKTVVGDEYWEKPTDFNI